MQFIFKKRIYGYECDIYGHLNNANYLPLLEAARSEALQEMGIPIQKLLDMRWHIYVLRFELDYIKAIQLEDIIEVRSRIISMNRVKGDWIQEIFNSKSELC
ncbi:MAG: acyl-CoA thioesterase, partial [Candidatus Cloacimonetes bacterium]|nr:acyl-CoA thioesterase [Candidatus Cloacimonadota bacterium]